LPVGRRVIDVDHDTPIRRRRCQGPRLRLMTVVPQGPRAYALSMRRRWLRTAPVLEHAGRKHHGICPLVGAFHAERARAAGLPSRRQRSGPPCSAHSKSERVANGRPRSSCAAATADDLRRLRHNRRLAKALEALTGPTCAKPSLWCFGLWRRSRSGHAAPDGRDLGRELPTAWIVTDDHPRSEDPPHPRRDPCLAPGAIEIGDLRAAIRRRLPNLRPFEFCWSPARPLIVRSSATGRWPFTIMRPSRTRLRRRFHDDIRTWIFAAMAAAMERRPRRSAAGT